MGVCVSRAYVVEQQNAALQRELGVLRERVENIRFSNSVQLGEAERKSARATADAVEKLRVELRVELSQKAAVDMARFRAELCSRVVADGAEKLRAELARQGGLSHVAPEFHSFDCPISRERMVDPVVAADGHTYERAAIEAWFAQHSTSPMTREKMWNQKLLPNHALRNAIDEASPPCNP